MNRYPVWEEDTHEHEVDEECVKTFYNPKWVFGASIFLIALLTVKIYFAYLLWLYAVFQKENEGAGT